MGGGTRSTTGTWTAGTESHNTARFGLTTSNCSFLIVRGTKPRKRAAGSYSISKMILRKWVTLHPIRLTRTDSSRCRSVFKRRVSFTTTRMRAFGSEGQASGIRRKPTFGRHRSDEVVSAAVVGSSVLSYSIPTPLMAAWPIPREAVWLRPIQVDSQLYVHRTVLIRRPHLHSLAEKLRQLLGQFTYCSGRYWLVGGMKLVLKSVLRGHKSAWNAVVFAYQLLLLRDVASHQPLTSWQSNRVSGASSEGGDRLRATDNGQGSCGGVISGVGPDNDLRNSTRRGISE